METLKKCSLITGASSGIGQALALELAKKGHNLVLMARNAEFLQQTIQECHQLGANAIAVIGDVSKDSDCQAFVNRAIQEFGRIDALYNNAGISMRALFKDAEVSVLESVMATNFWGTVYCTKYALPHLIESKGSIIGVSSVAGFKGLPARTGYSASKFAMPIFGKSAY